MGIWHCLQKSSVFKSAAATAGLLGCCAKACTGIFWRGGRLCCVQITHKICIAILQVQVSFTKHTKAAHATLLLHRMHVPLHLMLSQLHAPVRPAQKEGGSLVNSGAWKPNRHCTVAL